MTKNKSNTTKLDTIESTSKGYQNPYEKDYSDVVSERALSTTTSPAPSGSRYQLIDDYGAADGVISASPYWLLAVYSFQYPLTFDPRTQKSREGVTGMELLNPLIISSFCRSVTIQLDKGSPQKNLQAQLTADVDYMKLIKSGDWVFCWMFYGQDQLIDLSQRIQKGQPCNGFMDGFRFVGKVQSMREGISIDGRGNKTAFYQLQAGAFLELQATTYYNPALAMKEEYIGPALSRLGIAINQLIPEASKTEGILTESAIPTFLDLLLGKGISKAWYNPANSASLQIATGLQEPVPMAVPVEIGALLGKARNLTDEDAYSVVPKMNVMTYMDLAELHCGLQRFSTQVDTSPKNDKRYRAFIADGLQETLQYRSTGRPLMGSFIPRAPDLAGKSVWNILSQWVNPVINEMYTSFRVVDNYGTARVVPTITVRQQPFTTPAGADNILVNKANEKGGVTPYHELPRWVISPAMVTQYEVGRSDATRFNYIHVYGTSPIQQVAFALTAQTVRCPPIRDDLDIRRHGLRQFTGEVNCSLSDIGKEGPKKWMALAGDFWMGHYLTYSGTINCYGIPAPIAEGDNVELGGIIYHVETIVHQCNIDGRGNKSFVTSLNVVWGMRADAQVAMTDYEQVRRGYGPYMSALDSNEEHTVNEPVPLTVKFTKGSNVNLYPGLDTNNLGALEPAQNHDSLLNEILNQGNQ